MQIRKNVCAREYDFSGHEFVTSLPRLSLFRRQYRSNTVTPASRIVPDVRYSICRPSRKRLVQYSRYNELSSYRKYVRAANKPLRFETGNVEEIGQAAV